MLLRPRTALLAAAACLAGLVVTGLLAYLVPGAQIRDSASLNSFATLSGPRVDSAAEHIAHLADPGPYAIFAVGLIAVALARGRRRTAVAVALVIVLAPLTSELLKPLLAHARPADWLSVDAQVRAASWPSGHATASMTLALCAVLVAPPVLRPLAAVAGGLYALAVSFSILILVWHFPSDVIGGYFSAGMWTLVAVAALRRWPQAGRQRAEPVAPWAAAAPAVLLAAAAAGVAIAAALEHPRALLGHVVERPSFAIAAGVIAGLAAVLAGGLARGARAER
jgi:membrane-associated phospholipid phosphatase